MKQNFGFNQLMLCSALPWFHSDFVINVLHCIFLLFCVLVFVSLSLMLGSSFRSRSFQSLLLFHLRWVFLHFRRCSDVASFINHTSSILDQTWPQFWLETGQNYFGNEQLYRSVVKNLWHVLEVCVRYFHLI